MSTQETTYKSNPLLKKSNVNIEFTQEQLEEYIKCSQDPIYFLSKYYKIINLDKGLMTIELYDYQKDMINLFHTNKLSLVKIGRQMSKCSTFSTKLNLRNKITGEEIQLEIGKLFDMMKESHAET